jgi:excisionase family DNA binding protein
VLDEFRQMGRTMRDVRTGQPAGKKTSRKAAKEEEAMPRTKAKPKPARQPKAQPAAAPAPQPEPQPAAANGPPAEVLTLAEAAAYLRLPETDVIGAVSSQGLPGRLVGGEWRFLKAAIQQWLSVSQPTPAIRNAAMLAMAGAWKDDPYLEDMVEEIYRRRGRPITEDGSYRLSHGLNPEDFQK